jgi:ketosteroid isomerase-like protein
MKRLLLSIAAATLLVAPQLALGADADDLKAAYEKVLKAYNSLDAAAIASMIHPGAVNFDRNMAFPSVAPIKDTEAQLTSSLKASFAQIELLNITPVNYQCKVFGSTGIVWGYATTAIKLKDGPVRVMYSRVTSTWVKSGGKWLALMMHASAIPSGE